MPPPAGPQFKPWVVEQWPHSVVQVVAGLVGGVQVEQPQPQPHPRPVMQGVVAPQGVVVQGVVVQGAVQVEHVEQPLLRHMGVLRRDEP
jgi:hypothetical protein